MVSAQVNASARLRPQADQTSPVQLPVLIPLLLALLVSACDRDHPPVGGGYPTPPGHLIATVAGRPITDAMLQAEMSRRGAGDPGRFADPAAKQALLDTIIQGFILAERARAAGYDRDPEVLAALDQMLVARLRAADLEPRLAGVTVSDAEIAAEYQQRRADFTTPAMVRAALIRIAVPVGASAGKRAELRCKAQAILDEAKTLPPGDPGLGALAARHSDDRASRYRGGDTGWILRSDPDDRWPAEVRSGLSVLETPNEFAPLIEATDGFYIVRLTEQRPVQTQPLTDVAGPLGTGLRQRKQRELEADWLAGLRAQAPVAIDQAALEAVKPPAFGTPQDPVRPVPALPPG